MQALHPVLFNDLVFYVAFDRDAARRLADKTNDEYQCDVADIDELPLVDNFGFPCERKDAGFLFPWLGEVSDETAAAMLQAPFYMTPAERDAAELADDIAYWREHLA